MEPTEDEKTESFWQQLVSLNENEDLRVDVMDNVKDTVESVSDGDGAENGESGPALRDYISQVIDNKMKELKAEIMVEINDVSKKVDGLIVVISNMNHGITMQYDKEDDDDDEDSVGGHDEDVDVHNDDDNQEHNDDQKNVTKDSLEDHAGSMFIYILLYDFLRLIYVWLIFCDMIIFR